MGPRFDSQIFLCVPWQVLLFLVLLLILPASLIQPVAFVIAENLLEGVDLDSQVVRSFIFKYIPTLLALLINAGIIPA